MTKSRKFSKPMAKNALAYRPSSGLRPPSPRGRRPSLFVLLSPFRERVPVGRVRGLLVLALVGVCLSGCKKLFEPTYPGSKVAESVVALCAKEYKRLVDARRAGNSVQVMMPYMGEVESELTGIDRKA